MPIRKHIYIPDGMEDGDLFSYDVSTNAAVPVDKSALKVRSDEFTIAVIPDTQYLSRANPVWVQHFNAMADWLEENREAMNLRLVVHLGDVVENGMVSEFNRIEPAMSTIFDLGVPFVAVIGNHDYDGDPAYSNAIVDRDRTTRWNTFYGQDRYTSKPWWDGGFYESNHSENLYVRTILAGRPTLVMGLEFWPRADVMEWADGIIEDHPRHDVIVVTHGYLYNGQRADDGTSLGPNSYPTISSDASSGVTMWEDHLRHHPNVVAVYSGHFIPNNVSDRADYTDPGSQVVQSFTNWQGVGEGGDGRVVLLTVNPATELVRRRVYNSRTDTFEEESPNGPDDNEITYPFSSRLSRESLDRIYATGEVNPIGPLSVSPGLWTSPHGKTYGPSSGNNSARIFYVPVWLAAGDYDQIGLEITNGQSGGLFRLGVYAAVLANGLPGNRLAFTGELDGTSAAVVTAPISFSHAGGWVFLAAKANMGIAWQALGGQTLGMPLASAGGTNNSQCWRQTQAQANITLPAVAAVTEALLNDGFFAPNVKIRRAV